MSPLRREEFRARLKEALVFFGEVIESPELESRIPDGALVYSAVSSLSSASVDRSGPAETISTATPAVEAPLASVR